MKLTREQQRKVLDGVAEFVRDLAVTEFCEMLGSDKHSIGAVKDLMEDIASRVVKYHPSQREEFTKDRLIHHHNCKRCRNPIRCDEEHDVLEHVISHCSDCTVPVLLKRARKGTE